MLWLVFLSIMTDNKISFIRKDLLALNAYHPTPISKNTNLLTRLDANESPYDLPSEIKAKLASVYEQEIETNRYPDGGHFELKKTIAEYVNESANLDNLISVDNISVGNGSDELIRSILIATCLNQQGSILVANPTFSMYGILAETFGIPVIRVSRHESDFSLDLDEANKAINNPNSLPIRVVFVVHPNSPTANCLTSREINWLKELPNDILVVIDEAYYEFSQNTLVKELASHRNWLILRTFSKAFRLAAHRVGYAIAPNNIINVLEKIRLPYNLPTFSQLAALTALKNRELILPSVQEIMTEKQRVYENLNQNKKLQVWVSSANFIYLRLKNNSNAENHDQLMNQLKLDQIIIRHTGGGLRISIGKPKENDKLLDKIAILTK